MEGNGAKESGVSDSTMKPVEDDVMHRDSTTDGGANTRACAANQTISSSSTALSIPTMASSSTALVVPNTISEKRGGSELSPTSFPIGKKTRTVMHTTITPVTSVVTKKGQSVTITCNEEKEICLSDLADNISMENVVKILEMTDQVEAKDLQLAAEQFIIDNRKDLTLELKQELRGYSNFDNLF